MCNENIRHTRVEGRETLTCAATLAAFVLSALTATPADSRLADAVEKQKRVTIRILLKQRADVNALDAVQK